MAEKILAVGDIHSKSSLILPYIDKIIEVEKPTKIIFLGDYVDEWDASKYDVINELKLLVDFYNKHKKEKKYSVIMLCGNHDFQYLVEGAYCSGTNISIKDKIRPMLEELDLKLAYSFKDYLFTHAGLESYWANYYMKDVDFNNLDSIVTKLNKMLKEKSPSLNEASSARGGDWYPSPIWADKRDHIYDDNPFWFNQVVGHSPVNYVTNILFSKRNYDENDRKLFVCDSFSRASSGKPIGNGSLLLLTEKYSKDKREYYIDPSSLLPSEYGFDDYNYKTLLDWDMNID